MAQYLRPDTDIENYGSAWTPSTGTTLYECIDEETGSDTDYITGATQSYWCKIGLSPATDPQVNTGHVCRWRWKSTRVSTPPEKADLSLMQGGTLIATLAAAEALPTAWTAASYTLLSTEADAITDYSALLVRAAPNAIGASENMQISWFELEVPNAPSPGGDVSNLMLLGVG